MAETILIAEDDPKIFELAQLVLETKDFNLIWAQDGEEALALAKGRHPDLILLDVLMPKLNGYEVLHILKEDIRLREIPVIFLSAKAQTEDRVIGIRMGSQDYIAKPFDIYELVARVEAVFRMQGSLHHLRRPNRRETAFALADPLTGLYQADFFRERINEELVRAEKYGYSTACLVLEADHFERLRQDQGNWRTDQLMQHCGLLIKDHNRLVDPAGRMADGQFGIFLTQTDGQGAKAFAERLQKHILKSVGLFHQENEKITFSVGGVFIPKAGAPLSDEALINQAREALVVAQQQGGDRVVIVTCH